MKKLIIFIVLSLIMYSCENDCVQSTDDPNNQYLDNYTLAGEKNYYNGYEPMNKDSTFNAVIEIPAGTCQKWEVDKETGFIIWEIKNGAHRVVNYICYPANYGMIPKTLLPEEEGGDGDPIDIIVLGNAIERGKVVKVRIIGMIKLLDGGEKDDKLIGTIEDSQFSDILDMEGLDIKYPGVTSILSTWFSNYKGIGEIEFTGYGTKEEAINELMEAIKKF
jgi:inorganic pyrophosphatase